MALVSRLSRLFQADVHAVLDRIEEPDLQLRQAVREMQLSLDQDRQRLKLLHHEFDQITRALAEGEKMLGTFEAELDTCLAADKDDLARDLLRRKLGLERQLQALAKQAETITAQIDALEHQIDEQDQQLTSMKQKLELLVTDAVPVTPGQFSPGETIRNEEIEIALLREKERRAGS